MNTYDDNQKDKSWEQQINALLDGELSESEADALKHAATDNTELARLIVEAYQLQQMMAGLPQDRAPASLTKRLLAVPAEQKAKQKAEQKAEKAITARGWFRPGWVMAVAAVPLVVIAMNMMQPKQPSAEEIAQARHDLAIAFAYLDKAGRVTGREIESTVGNTMTDAITGSVFKNVKSQYELSKENST
jgi:anti-sigma factor RsiW